LATAWFGNPLQMPSVTTRDGTLVTLSRYIREPIPDVVLVGSSLTFRLKEEYFATPRIRTLELSGGSPITGLEIVANQSRLPRLVLVETNLVSRAADGALVEKYSRGHAEPMFFRPIRAAVAAYEGWLHAPLSHTDVSTILKQPPSDFDNHVYVERALAQWNAEDPTAPVRVNVGIIEQLIASIERRGARVLLYELPCSEQLEGSRSARITHEIVHARFPDPDRWLHFDFTRSELRWADGVHLDERSAAMIARSMDRAISSLPGSR
jgi:hypothetical protein